MRGTRVCFLVASGCKHGSTAQIHRLGNVYTSEHLRRSSGCRLPHPDCPILDFSCFYWTHMSQAPSSLCTHHCYLQQHLSNQSHCLQLCSLGSILYTAAHSTFLSSDMPFCLFKLFKGASLLSGYSSSSSPGSVTLQDSWPSPTSFPSFIFCSPTTFAVVPECSVFPLASTYFVLLGMCTHHCLNFQIANSPSQI